MRAIDILMHEHRIIERVLDALEAYADDIEMGKDLPLADLIKFATFAREFADRCHHGKEEDILFESMVNQGFPKEGGPIGVMLQEHTEGRARVKSLAAAIEQPGWTPALRDQVIADARAYVGLLRGHIQKEDQILYPLAVQNLPQERMEAMADEFDRFEESVTGKGVHERYHKLADELIARYAPPGHAHRR